MSTIEAMSVVFFFIALVIIGKITRLCEGIEEINKSLKESNERKKAETTELKNLRETIHEIKSIWRSK
jgi:hypothetical protein